ncbi:MAG: inner membrane protein [Candidatus Nanohaloarchaea archaeon]|jgi:inner membrane protein
MLGRQHLMLSVSTASVMIIPLIEKLDGFLTLITVGVVIGSLIPDVDASDATVFHKNVKGLPGRTGQVVNMTIAPILPFFGYSTKYLIYKPAVTLFKMFLRGYSFRDGHRTFSHSFLGVFIMTAATGLYLAPPLIYIGLMSLPHLAAFLAGYFFGALMHMLQDSCTKSGIAWNAPFSDTKLKGKLKTGKDNREPRFLFYIFMMQIPGILYLVLHTPSTAINSFLVSLAAVSVTWTVFVFGVAEAKFT